MMRSRPFQKAGAKHRRWWLSLIPRMPSSPQRYARRWDISNGKRVPGVAVGRIVLPDGPPLTFAEVGSPAPPMRFSPFDREDALGFRDSPRRVGSTHVRKFRFDEHATARPAGLHRSRRRGAPGVARHERPRQLRDGDRRRDAHAELSWLLIAALDPPVADACWCPRCARSAVPGRQLRAGDEPLGLGWRVPEGWRLSSRSRRRRRADLDLRSATPNSRSRSRCRTATIARRSRCASCAPSSRCATARVLVADRDHHGGWLPDPERFTSTSTAIAPVALPDCGRTVHVAMPGAVMSPHRDRWSGFFAARESERGLNALTTTSTPRRAPHAGARQRGGHRGGTRSGRR